MPDIPWTTPTAPAPDAEVYLMASRFETRTLLDAVRFFLKAPGIVRQIRKAPGAHGAALRARVFGRTFYTLSAWQDRDALYRFARSEPHRSSSRALAASMKDSTFTFWTAPAAALPITWPEAVRRLADADADADAEAEAERNR
ncbi:DUF3291 domain-containing protein [Streptomyces antimicrobicus]|uniref:DUF4188 domain-containing protein n=1 Tax=Streptomyces antimicrobicus TaxID=2883108 RepID=A0ABS8B273_9ACTN|nr:DUF3291 domain-containing protein [Streptomyces antimicrobicus]MCB5178667.1 DUF4188 domain-containing protein [Streptomyces antimicrobicus]